MSRIMITGNQGFFGTRFELRFGAQHTILGVDKDEVDIVDEAAVREAVQAFRPELVIHAAAVTATAFSNEHPDLTRRINVDGAVHVAQAAASVGARMIFFSTEQVFNGNEEPGPYRESDEPLPDTMYGITKLEAEAKVKEAIDDLWILRFTWLCGLPERAPDGRALPVNPNIIWNALQIALQGERVQIPVHEYRGHTWGHDMIGAVMQVPEIPYGTYHIGSRNDLGRYEVTRHVLRELGLTERRIAELVEPDHERYAHRHRDIRLDTSLICDAGIPFETTEVAISRALRESGLLGVAAG